VKTFLKDTEFVDVFWHLMNRKMTDAYTAGAGDKISWYLFQEFEKDVKETLKGAMQGIEDFESDNAAELIGYQFHKAFRQWDPIDARYLNSIVWTCLQDAEVFWECIDKACKILVSSDLAEHYKELITD
jgi:hypothetical protein